MTEFFYNLKDIKYHNAANYPPIPPSIYLKLSFWVKSILGRPNGQNLDGRYCESNWTWKVGND